MSTFFTKKINFLFKSVICIRKNLKTLHQLNQSSNLKQLCYCNYRIIIKKKKKC